MRNGDDSRKGPYRARSVPVQGSLKLQVYVILISSTFLNPTADLTKFNHSYEIQGSDQTAWNK